MKFFLNNYLTSLTSFTSFTSLVSLFVTIYSSITIWFVICEKSWLVVLELIVGSGEEYIHNFDFVNTLYFFTLKDRERQMHNDEWNVFDSFEKYDKYIHTCTKFKIWLCIIDIYISFSSWIQLRTNSLYFIFLGKQVFPIYVK